jgi:hypothetical protein
VFADYHLRVGEVVIDTEGSDLAQTRLDLTEVGDAPYATVTEVQPGEDWDGAPPEGGDPLGVKWFSGINTESKRLLFAAWGDEQAAQDWIGSQPAGPRFRLIRVVRDYGMHDREEAPQFYPAVEEDRQAA